MGGQAHSTQGEQWQKEVTSMMARLELYINDRLTDECPVANTAEVYALVADWKQQYGLAERNWQAYLVRPVDIGFITSGFQNIEREK